MKAYGEMNVYIHIFLTSVLVEGEWSASRPGVVSPPPRKISHWVGGWVSPNACLDDVEKRKFFSLSGLELRTLGRVARSQSLYRLRLGDGGG
jgi:hypothetical protein